MDRWMGKDTVRYVFSQKRRPWHLKQHGWTGRQYAKWNTSDPERKSCMISLYVESKKVEYTEAESAKVVPRGRWEGGGIRDVLIKE